MGALTPESAAIFRALLKRMRAQCTQLPKAANLWVVYLPTPGESCAGEANAIGAWVAHCSGQLGLPHLDLTPNLHAAWADHAERGDQGQPVFLARDKHWSSLGHALVGGILADWLQEL